MLFTLSNAFDKPIAVIQIPLNLHNAYCLTTNLALEHQEKDLNPNCLSEYCSFRLSNGTDSSIFASTSEMATGHKLLKESFFRRALKGLMRIKIF